MPRLQDWPRRLEEFIEARRNMPFTWGAHDCCLFAADAVLAMTGDDPARGMRGYSGPRSAVQTMRDASRGTLSEALDLNDLSAFAAFVCFVRGFQELERPAFAQRGDVVVIMCPRPTLGVVASSGLVATPGEHGLVFVPLAQAVRAWRV